VLSVVGRNGMGKTTLCKAIMGLVPISSGSISFGGQSLVGLSPADDRAAWHRLCAAGPPPLALADGR
jgi:ABC-type branched-subunit amino acid transport system ATPase component